MEQFPLVSIICLCYNHEKFLEEAIVSVIEQEYPNKEIIIVDDKSSDGSVQKIKNLLANYPSIRFIEHTTNIGNCASFNEAMLLCKGAFIIDFATDDVMMPGRIRKQVEKFNSLPLSYGVVYSDAEVIDESGTSLGFHHKGTQRENFHPEGDVFKFVLWKYFINPPSMMMRREVLEYTKGYDTSLAYEDFNFWVESSRSFHYAYIDEPLVKRRVVGSSLSMSFYSKNRLPVFQTTLTVLHKAFHLCKTDEERGNLANRIKFEFRHAVLMEYYSLAKGYKELLQKLHSYSFFSKLLSIIATYKLPVFWLYKPLLQAKGVYKKR